LNHFVVTTNYYQSKSNLTVSLEPDERFTTPQYLIEDKGFIRNSLNLIRMLLLHKKSLEVNYQQLISTPSNYIHFNPFRASLVIYQAGTTYRLKVNVPDATVEFWQENVKLDHFSIKPPWLRLILFPFLSSLTLAAILFQSIILLIKIFTSKESIDINILLEEKKIPENQLFTRLLLFMVFVLGTILISFIFIKVFKAMPGFGDEMNYLIQAKIFASGKIFVKEPANPEFFRVSWMDIFGNDGKLWNFHPIGNSIILAIGQIIKVPWITVPVVGGLILLTQYLIAKKLFNNQMPAVFHVIIVATSHYFLSLASSYMAHTPSLLFISLFYLFVIKLIKEKKQKNLIFAAVTLGFAFIIRPLSAVLAAIIPLFAVVIFILKQRKINYYYLAGSLLIGLLIASTIFMYTYLVSGRWTLPYFVKGPEKDQTLSVRWEKSRDFKLSNLYRNANEFQNRVHSFGYVVNYVFFLIPLLTIMKNKKKWWVISAYMTFFLYLVIHSFLHWYGWKWEPRTIYDISFLFFLLTTHGLWIVYQIIKKIQVLKYGAVTALILSLIYVGKIDLPRRFSIEYKNYNFQPIGVKEAIIKNKISNAIIFFANEYVFAPYTPENKLTFDGDIIYAIDQGAQNNCRLINKFQGRKIYYSPDAQILIKKQTICY
jgi:hypothetical protein